MPTVPPAAFARQLRSLSDAELAAFVADLWAARGFETTVEGSTVVAERAGGTEPVTIRCGHARAVDTTTIDIAVDVSRRPTADPDARVLGPEALRERLLYAVDRETADGLVRTHCGRSLAAQPADEPLGQRLPGTTARQLLAVGLVVVLAVGVAIGASGGPVSFGTTGQSVPSAPGPPTVSGTTPGDEPATATVSGTHSGLPAAGGDLFRYPPGLGPAGVTDADALAAAHRAAVANVSWTLAIAHVRSLDLLHPYRVWTESRQTVVRANASHYEYHVTATERTGNDSLASVTYVDYADGRHNYRRLIGLHGDAYRRTGLPEPTETGVFATVSAAYVRRYLSTTESRVETVRAGSTTRQRVVATGTPTALARTVANYTAVAVVDRRGVVYRLTVEYTLLERVPDPIENGVATPYAPADRVPTEPRGTVRFELRFEAVGNTSLQPPGWYEPARNATNATGVPPWPTDPAV